jgi:hypothetical protein
VISCRHAGYSLLLGLALLAADTPTGQGVEEILLALGDIGGEGWSLERVEVRLAWIDDHSVVLRLNALRARLPEPFGRLDGLHAECERLVYSPTAIGCREGNLHLGYPGAESLRFAFDYGIDSGRLVLTVDGFRMDSGRLAAKLELEQARWKLTLRGNALQLAGISTRLSAAGVLASPVTGAGTVDFTANLLGEGVHLPSGTVSARLQTGEFSDARGALAGDGLALSLEVAAKPVAGHWQISARVDAEQGQLYVEPMFVDLGARPVQASADLDWQASRGILRIHTFDYRQPGLVSLRATGQVSLSAAVPRVEALFIDLVEGRLPGLYDTYLQPWLNDTVLADLETSGAVTATVDWEQSRMTAMHLDLDEVSLDDREGRYGLVALDGRIDWAAQQTPRRSDLRWGGGHLFRVPLGVGRLAVESTASALHLREPAHVDVLDGKLQIDKLEFAFPADASWGWRVDGILTPVSLPRLCRSLGWPEFAGKISGVIPDVRYADGRLEVGGVLLVRAFDGEIILDKLKLLQPLSPVPQLRLDARVHNIDLKALTGAFSFGRIEGRLDGRIDGLKMEAWRPVAFDASFATPPGDTSRHRISQKAVDNISSIGGGGVGGALSRSVLRFFEDFPYDKLGFRCRLEDGICEMGGVAPAPNGYYLVKGRLLPPRLDVIGYADRVDWRSLVAQLAAVTRRQSGAMAQ